MFYLLFMTNEGGSYDLLLYKLVIYFVKQVILTFIWAKEKLFIQDVTMLIQNQA